MKKYLQDYIPFTDNDMTLAATLAVNDCQEGDTLCLGGGELHFYPENAFEKFYYISNNDFGIKKIVFPLIEKESLTIDGEGAKLIFHGKMMPFAIEKCKHIVIKNLTIDYAEAMYFQAKIIASGEDFVEMQYDESAFRCDIANNLFRVYGENWENCSEKVLVNEYDPEYKGPTPQTPTYFAFFGSPQEAPAHHASLYRYLKASKPAENILRLDGEIGYAHTVGKYWLGFPNIREYPGIFACESAELSFQNLILHRTLSMGIICQICENIKIDSVVVVPSEGRLLSTNADVTHFVNCCGLVQITNCKFESMMDDAGNFHGFYVPVYRRIGDYKVMLKFGHHQQRGVNIFKPGDKVRLVDNRTLQPYAYFEVKNSKLLAHGYLLLETMEKLPLNIPEGHAFENYTRMPEVHIEGCSTGYNRPRGFLLSTCKKAVVENCEFYNLGHAIAIMGDANSWYESGPCGEIILRNNRFVNSAYCGCSVIEGSPEIAEKAEDSYHGTLVVENNSFRTNGRRFMKLSSFEQVIFRNNTFEQDDTLPIHAEIGKEGFLLKDCKDAKIDCATEII